MTNRDDTQTCACGGYLADAKVPGYLYCTRCGKGSIPKAPDTTVVQAEQRARIEAARLSHLMVVEAAITDTQRDFGHRFNECLESANALIAAVRAESPAWQPIETAPAQERENHASGSEPSAARCQQFLGIAGKSHQCILEDGHSSLHVTQAQQFWSTPAASKEDVT